MGKLGIPDRYIDAFYGKVLKKCFGRALYRLLTRKAKPNLKCYLR
jgi:hypothetical protein